MDEIGGPLDRTFTLGCGVKLLPVAIYISGVPSPHQESFVLGTELVCI